jgi:hypothetical protein
MFFRIACATHEGPLSPGDIGNQPAIFSVWRRAHYNSLYYSTNPHKNPQESAKIFLCRFIARDLSGVFPFMNES